MIALDPVWLLLAGEGAGILMCIPIVWLALAMRRRGRDRKAVAALVESVKASADDRNQATVDLLKTMALDNEQRDAVAAELKSAETHIYQHFINAYARHDAALAERFPAAVEGLLTQLRALRPAAAPEIIHAPPEQDKQISQLTQEKERLAEELQITRDTMAKMLTEYTTMFAGGAEGATGGKKPALMHEFEPKPDSVAMSADDADLTQVITAAVNSPDEDADDELDLEFISEQELAGG